MLKLLAPNTFWSLAVRLMEISDVYNTCRVLHAGNDWGPAAGLVKQHSHEELSMGPQNGGVRVRRGQVSQDEQTSFGQAPHDPPHINLLPSIKDTGDFLTGSRGMKHKPFG